MLKPRFNAEYARSLACASEERCGEALDKVMDTIEKVATEGRDSVDVFINDELIAPHTPNKPYMTPGFQQILNALNREGFNATAIIEDYDARGSNETLYYFKLNVSW